MRLARSDGSQGNDEMDTTLAGGLIAFAFGAGYLVGKNGIGAKSPSPRANPDPKALEAVRPILAAEGKIAAIKAYREMTGAGLRDAKLAVETIE